MISRPLVGYILTAARRDKLMITLALMIALGAALSVFLGSATILEGEQFSLVFSAGGLRILGVLGIVLFVSFYMRRAFEHKEIEFLLSRPISRITFLFSHAAAFMILSVAIAFVVVLPMLFTGVPDLGGLGAWGLSIAVEYAVMAVAALFFSMVLSSAAGSALATLGLYVFARLIGTLIGITMIPSEHAIFNVLGKVLDVISTVVPRLDLMGQTSWLLYGVSGADTFGVMKYAEGYGAAMIQHLGAAGFVLFQGAFFITLLLAASAFDFARRRF